mmetsp:Transcript_17052/g.19143  ORF Transcript_17052/g.19143 Transcript_17052/m.19143 type:complete len:236 (-) Transcript_17052:819-1526(-)
MEFLPFWWESSCVVLASLFVLSSSSSFVCLFVVAELAFSEEPSFVDSRGFVSSASWDCSCSPLLVFFSLDPSLTISSEFSLILSELFFSSRFSSLSCFSTIGLLSVSPSPIFSSTSTETFFSSSLSCFVAIESVSTSSGRSSSVFLSTSSTLGFSSRVSSFFVVSSSSSSSRCFDVGSTSTFFGFSSSVFSLTPSEVFFSSSFSSCVVVSLSSSSLSGLSAVDLLSISFCFFPSV